MKLNKFMMGVMTVAVSASFVACNDDDDYYINTSNIISEVTTGSAETTATTATVTGTVKDLSSQSANAYTVGAVYGTDEASLLTSGTRRQGTLGEDGYTVTTTISGLSDGVTYYYATFVTLQGKVSEYGEIKSFVTTDSQMGTADAASVTATSANLGATLNGVSDLIEQGMEHGVIISSDPSKISDGIRLPASDLTNSYTVQAKELVPQTTYHYAAYMMLNDILTIDENVKNFTTEKFYDPSNEESELYVDMGLDKDWATCNIGAETPSAQGALVGYGDITGLMRSVELSDYATEAISGTSADIAVAAGAGLTPSAADWQALLANSDVAVEDVDGAKVYRITSKITGNSIVVPVVSSRDGEEQSTLGGYWTGSLSDNNKDYAKMYVADGSSLTPSQASRHIGLAVRPVRNAPYRAPKIDNAKISFGDLENNGKIRIEIYNEYGNTKDALNKALVNFSENMTITFRISGLTGAAASGSFPAALSYVSDDWAYQDWGSNTVDINGNGIYSITLKPGQECVGATVWCIDIDGLGTAIGDDKSALVCEILSIDLDYGKVEFVGKNMAGDTPTVFGTFDNSKLGTGDLENNGNFRIDIFNEYGATGADPGIDTSMISFSSEIAVTFTLEGLNGAAATKEYQAGMSYVSDGWAYQNWGDEKFTVKGDGTYTARVKPGQDCTGAIVWCIDIPGMSNDIDDPTFVIANIQNIVLDNGAVIFRGHNVSKSVKIFDNSKLAFGDLENNGKIRLDIYNEYGETGADPGLNKSLVNFSEDMTVTFRISGLTGAAASGSFQAALSYVSNDWAYQDWGSNTVEVNGDGTYSITLKPGQECVGATVWCIDIDGLGTAIGEDKSNLKCEIVSISLDGGKLIFAGK